MNRVILMGRLTRDPNITYAQKDNSAIGRFTIAVDRRVARSTDANQQTADFISCVTFGKQAEFVEKYLRQGTKVALEGRIQTGSYTNKEGQKVYTTDIVVDNIEFAESKNAQGGGNGQSYERPQPSGTDSGFMNVPDGIDEELPFA